MPGLSDAVDQFLATLDARGNLDEVEQAAGAVHAAIPGSSPAELDGQLRRLRVVLEGGRLGPAGVTAVTCGSIVEHGGDPAVCGPALLDLLPEFLRRLTDFHADIRSRSGGDDPDADFDELVERHLEDVFAADPDAAWAYFVAEPLTLGTIAHLSRSKALRAAARARPELLALADEADAAAGEEGFLSDMLRVLDDERLVVLHPGEAKGFEVRISGVADNFQLHTLLADALIGDPAGGWLPGEKPDSAVAALARDAEFDPDEPLPHTTGAFNLWNWTGLGPDGRLPEGQTGDEHWVWGEGRPADVRPFDGVRVVLLGPPPYERGWNAGRRFPGMAGELAVERVLPPAEVRDWLARIAAAPRPAGGDG